MAKNWSAYEAAKEIYGDNKENIAEIGSRFPLFARTVAIADSNYLLDILKALPKVTARVVETGLKDMDGEDVDIDIEDDVEETEAPKKEKKNPKSKKPVDDEWEEDAETETSEYESMSSKDLYALCCKRGISSQCKSRSKGALIEMLTKLDNGEIESAGDKKKADTSKKSTKTSKKAEEPEEDDWDDEEEDTDPYAGKTARELFTMCKERGIKTKPQQKADVYAKLLKADDAKDEAEEDEDDDDWDI